MNKVTLLFVIILSLCAYNYALKPVQSDDEGLQIYSKIYLLPEEQQAAKVSSLGYDSGSFFTWYTIYQLNHDIIIPPDTIELNVEFDDKNIVLVKGQKANVTGKITTMDGQLLVNNKIGLDDGLRKICTTMSTDSQGRFSFFCTPNFIGTGVLAFYSKDYSICYKAIPVIESKNNYKISSLPCQSINIKNESCTDLKAKLTVNIGSTYETVRFVNLPANKTTEVIKLQQPNSFPFKLCSFSGLQATTGLIAGGETSVTLDCEGKSTVSVSGGVLLLRGSIYWLPKSTSEIGGGGICWSPGGDIGVTPTSASGEVSLCIGSDGLSISGDMSLSAVVGGIQLQIIEFE